MGIRDEGLGFRAWVSSGIEGIMGCLGCQGTRRDYRMSKAPQVRVQGLGCKVCLGLGKRDSISLWVVKRAV